MKLIILNGSPCSGKSTIIKHIMKKEEHLFYLSYDALKRSFSQYEFGKFHDDVYHVVLAVAEAVFKMKYDVICDTALYKITKDKIINLAKEHEYKVLEVNLETEWDVLLDRYKARVAKNLANTDTKIANISPERFKELFDTYNNEKNNNAISFHTDIGDGREVAEKIMKLS
ncbi:MAG: ATP-binding protein [bacterium]|nr:ATP-binding protein [bacterium]